MNLVLPFDGILRSIHSTTDCSSGVFRSISDIFVFDMLERFVRSNHVERIRLQFRQEFEDHPALKCRGYFVGLAKQKKIHMNQSEQQNKHELHRDNVV